MPDEIGIPSFVVKDMLGALCGYHLALARPAPGLADGAFLARALGSRAAAQGFARIANGVTRSYRHGVPASPAPCRRSGTPSVDSEHLHHFVAEVVDDLHPMRPGSGLSKGREVSLCRVSHTASLISALSVVLSALYGSFWPRR